MFLSNIIGKKMQSRTSLLNKRPSSDHVNMEDLETEAEDFDYRDVYLPPEAYSSFWLNINWLYELSESGYWNGLVCVVALAAFLVHSMSFQSEMSIVGCRIHNAIDLIHNILFAVHSLSILFNDIYRIKHEQHSFKNSHWLWYLLDLASYAHYSSDANMEHTILDVPYMISWTCYCYRMHRPFRYLLHMYDYYLHGSPFGTLLKYTFFFIFFRILVVDFCLLAKVLDMNPKFDDKPDWLENLISRIFFRGFLVLHSVFHGLGSPAALTTFGRNLTFLISSTTAAYLWKILECNMALVKVLRLYSEELFQARFSLIMTNMRTTHIPHTLSEKVETFYKMYWLKQKAVSVTKLLPTYPPTLLSDIKADIYFEAQQKSILMKDLSYQMLSEIAKMMVTINYIPGDTIIMNDSTKGHIVYIAYGDVEVLTADDDETPMLRFTRGTILNPCGGFMEVACSNAHVLVRAATFCTAHVLAASDLWRILWKYGADNGQAYIARISFKDHLERVQMHYDDRPHPPVKYKSSVLHLKHNLMELKEARDEHGTLLLGNNDIFLEIASCYIMRNRRDFTLTEDTDLFCLRSTFPCILQPTSSLLTAWSIFITLVTVIVTILYPLNMFYKLTIPPTIRFLDVLVTFVFILDTVVYISIGANIEEGLPISFTQSASQQMQTIWFVLDIMSVMPLFEFVGDGRFSGINKLLKLPKVYKFLLDCQTGFSKNIGLTRFLTYASIFVLLWWIIAFCTHGYICFRLDYCVAKFIDGPLEYGPLNDNDLVNLLYISFTWSISIVANNCHRTTADTWRYILYFIFLTECLGITNALLKSSYAAGIIATHTMRDRYKRCLNNVQKFLETNYSNQVIRHRFLEYLQLCWYSDMGYRITTENTTYLFDLPPHVHQEITALQRNKYVNAIPFMKYLLDDELKHVYAHTKGFHTSPNEILLNTGDISNEVYVIKQGFCEVIDPVTKKVVALLESKNSFGDIECLLRLPAYNTVRAVTHVELYTISRMTFMKSLSASRFRNAIILTKKSDEYQQLKKNPREPFLKYEIPPEPANRMFFPLPRKHLPDSAFIGPFSRLGFFSILRYVFPRFTIRPDGKYIRSYECVRAVIVMSWVVMTPVQTFFELQFEWFEHLDTVFDLCSYFDIMQRMLIGYFDENGILVYHPASTAVHYIKGSFVTDLLCCIPLETLDTIRNTIYFDNNAYRVTAMTQILSMNHFGQLYRIPGAVDIIGHWIQREDLIYVFKTIPFLLSAIVILAGLILDQSVLKWAIVGGGYRFTLKKEPRSINGSWIIRSQPKVRYNITGNAVNLILTGVYWLANDVTSTGYNIFYPSNQGQMIIFNVGLVLTSLMILYFAVRVISIRSHVNLDLAEYQENMNDLNVFMKKEDFPTNLQGDVIAHFEHTWDKTGGIDNRYIFKLCNHITLRTDVILDIYGDTFHKNGTPLFVPQCPILYNCDLSLLRLLGRAVYNEHICEGISIIDRQDVISNMYFVDSGVVESRDVNDDEMAANMLPRGSVFGNLDMCKYIVSPNKFAAECNVHLLKLETQLFYTIIQDFPSVQVLMKKYRQKSEFHNYITGSLYGREFESQRKKSQRSAFATESASGTTLQSYLDPRKREIQLYLILVCLASVCADTVNAGFHINSKSMLYILYILDGAFAVKILLIYILRFILQEEPDKRRKSMIYRREYFKGDFVYDAISLLPLELFSLFFKNKMFIFAQLRLNRVFRMVTLDKCMMSYHEKLNINLTLSTLASVVLWFFLLIHANTCFLFWLGETVDHFYPKTSWRWMDTKNGSRHYQCKYNYYCALQFILNTFTHNNSPNLLPRHQAEVVYITILFIVALYVFMVYEGHFTNILQYRLLRFLGFYSDYLELQNYLENNRVSPNLIEKTNKYTLTLWRASRGHQAPLFMNKAPDCMRLNIMSAAYMKHLQVHSLFSQCEKSFRRQLAGCFKPFYYTEDMYVVREGEITNSMYFVHRGRVDELSDDEFTGFVYHAGTYFGSISGLNTDCQYACSYKTNISSEILTLNFTMWQHLLNHFPKAQKVIYSDPHYKNEADQWRRRSSARDTNEARFSMKVSSRRQSEAFLPPMFMTEDRDGDDAGRPSVVRRKSILIGVPDLPDDFKPPETARRKSILIGSPEFGRQQDEPTTQPEDTATPSVARRKSILIGAPDFERRQDEPTPQPEDTGRPSVARRKSILIGAPDFERRQDEPTPQPEDTGRPSVARRKSILIGAPDFERRQDEPTPQPDAASRRKSILIGAPGFERQQEEPTSLPEGAKRKSIVIGKPEYEPTQPGDLASRKSISIGQPEYSRRETQQAQPPVGVAEPKKDKKSFLSRLLPFGKKRESAAPPQARRKSEAAQKFKIMEQKPEKEVTPFKLDATDLTEALQKISKEAQASGPKEVHDPMSLIIKDDTEDLKPVFSTEYRELEIEREAAESKTRKLEEQKTLLSPEKEVQPSAPEQFEEEELKLEDLKPVGFSIESIALEPEQEAAETMTSKLEEQKDLTPVDVAEPAQSPTKQQSAVEQKQPLGLPEKVVSITSEQIPEFVPIFLPETDVPEFDTGIEKEIFTVSSKASFSSESIEMPLPGAVPLQTPVSGSEILPPASIGRSKSVGTLLADTTLALEESKEELEDIAQLEILKGQKSVALFSELASEETLSKPDGKKSKTLKSDAKKTDTKVTEKITDKKDQEKKDGKPVHKTSQDIPDKSTQDEQSKSLWPLDSRKSMAVFRPKSTHSIFSKDALDRDTDVHHSDSDVDIEDDKPDLDKLQKDEVKLEKDDRNLSLDLPSTSAQPFSPQVDIQSLKDPVLKFKDKPVLLGDDKKTAKKHKVQKEPSLLPQHLLVEDIEENAVPSASPSQTEPESLAVRHDKRASSFTHHEGLIRYQSEGGLIRMESIKDIEDFMDFSSTDMAEADTKQKTGKLLFGPVRIKSITARPKTAAEQEKAAKDDKDAKEKEKGKENAEKESKPDDGDLDEEGSEIFDAKRLGDAKRRRSLF